MRKMTLLMLALFVPLAACGPGEEASENTAAACQDSSDNDGDGATDCDDSECSSFVFCSGDNNGTNNNMNTGTNGGTNSTMNSGTNSTMNSGTNSGMNSSTNNGTNNSSTNNGTGGTNNTTNNGTNNNQGGINISASISPNFGPLDTEVTVNFTTLTGITFNEAAIGEAHVVGEGHYHVYLDQVDADHELLVSGTNPDTFMMNLANVTVETGNHDVIIVVHKNDHSEYTNPIQFSINFEVTTE